MTREPRIDDRRVRLRARAEQSIESCDARVACPPRSDRCRSVGVAVAYRCSESFLGAQNGSGCRGGGRSLAEQQHDDLACAEVPDGPL
jgi:hypothetical protein